jgi:hypothetical protein
MPFPFRRTVDASYASAHSIPITTGSFVAPAATLQIPAARPWVVFAKVSVSNTGGGQCRVDAKLSLGGGGGDLDNSGLTVESSSGSYGTISLQSAWVFQSAGSVDLFLLTFFNAPAEAANIKMTAIRVDNLSSGTLP